MRALTDACGFMLPQWLYVAIKLGLPETLMGKSLNAQELALELSVPHDRLTRLLYALEQHGYFRRVITGTSRAGRNEEESPWTHTALSAVLAETHPNSVRAIVLHWVEDCFVTSSALLEAFRTNTCAFSIHHRGKHRSFFQDYLTEYPQQSKQFSKAMSQSSAFTSLAVLRDFDWSRYTEIIDVGGASGSFLEMVLKANPKARGVLFDLEAVIDGAEAVWTEKPVELTSRVTLRRGSFFHRETIPILPKRSTFVLRNILHDWPDDDCLRLLSNLRQSMPEQQSSLILIEFGLGFDSPRHILEQARSTIDMLMMVMFDGRERTHHQLERLLSEAGFRIKSVTPTRSIAHIIEATPI